MLWWGPIRISARKLSKREFSFIFLTPSTLVYVLLRLVCNSMSTDLPVNRYCIIWDPGRVAEWTKSLILSSVSDVAHGNFSAETPPSQDIPVQSDVYVEKKHASGQGDLPGTYTTETSER